MSKLDYKIEFYNQSKFKKEISIYNQLLKIITRGLSPSVFKKYAESVSTFYEKEVFSIKRNFLMKKLVLEDSSILDGAICKRCK